MTNNSFSLDNLERVGSLPLLLSVNSEGKKTIEWAKQYAANIQDLLKDNGALLLRGLKVHGSKQFGLVLETLFGDKLVQYKYRSTPRTELRGNVYTATEYPANETIPQHNENAYSRKWPNRIGFLCMVPPSEGGETPISDSRVIYQNIPTPVREKFEEKGVLYVRNYSEIDLPWSEVFQTESKDVVEQYCEENELQYEWLDNNALRTKQVNPAVLEHPLTQEKLWFNQAHLFHVSNLSDELQRTLIDSLGEENLPRNTFYGDGSPIGTKDLESIREVYDQHAIKFAWQKDDLLLLDNMLFTHGRLPYTGDRKVLTGMSHPNQ